MTSPADDIRRLVQLINTAAEDAIQQYESSGSGVPSITSNAWPKLPQDVLPLKRSLRILEGACQQLIVTLTPPDIAIYTVSCSAFIAHNSFIQRFCNYSGLLLLVLIWLASASSSTLTSPTYSLIIRKVCPCRRLVRRQDWNQQSSFESCVILPRSTVSERVRFDVRWALIILIHCVVAAGVFVNNPISLALRSDQPVYSMAKLRANRLHEHAFGRLWDTLSDPEYGQSDSVDKCAFAYGIKDEMPGGTLFSWLREHVCVRLYRYNCKTNHVLLARL